MKIVGFGLSKILGERNVVSNSQLKLSQNIEIKSVTKEKLPVSNEDSIHLKFRFVIEYSEGFGKIEFEGTLVILPDKDEQKDFLKAQKESSIPESKKAIIFNYIMTKCNVKALVLEDDLNLPYHISLPRIQPKEEKNL